jgi:hypothetical protein
MSTIEREQEIEAAVRHSEGLVKETANQIVERGVELDFEDIAQLLRIKVWHAACKFSEERAAASPRLGKPRDKHGRTPLERFIFTCVANLRKDIEKRPRHHISSIDEIRDRCLSSPTLDAPNLADWFDLRYLSVDHEQVFGAVEDDAEHLLPSTLTHSERQVALLRLNGKMLMEIDRELGLSRAQREELMRSIQAKVADWHPSAEPTRGPTLPLPGAEPRQAHARVPLAA